MSAVSCLSLFLPPLASRGFNRLRIICATVVQQTIFFSWLRVLDFLDLNSCSYAHGILRGRSLCVVKQLCYLHECCDRRSIQATQTKVISCARVSFPLTPRQVSPPNPDKSHCQQSYDIGLLRLRYEQKCADLFCRGSCCVFSRT